MRSPVNDELSGLDEGFAADFARVRPLSGVNAHVAMELARVLHRRRSMRNEHMRLRLTST